MCLFSSEHSKIEYLAENSNRIAKRVGLDLSAHDRADAIQDALLGCLLRGSLPDKRGCLEAYFLRRSGIVHSPC